LKANNSADNGTVDGQIIADEGQPRLWHHALLYLAALEAFGSE